MPGTAADAMIAVKMMQSGAVCTLRSFVGECVSYGMTDTLRMLEKSAGSQRKSIVALSLLTGPCARTLP